MPDREAATKDALSMYLGEHCRFCGLVFANEIDMKNRQAVFAGYVVPDDGTRLACKACWEGRPQ